MISVNAELFETDKINQINTDDSIHGLLIQLPLPKHLNEAEALKEVIRGVGL